MSVENIINIQKELAKDVLKKLEAIDPNCILAGGAPRDWFFSKPANDLDFYIYLEEGVADNLTLRLKALGFEGIKTLGNTDPTYKSLKKLRKVVEFEYKGQRIQVMLMKEPTFYCVINHFNLDTSKAWWKGGYVHYESDFILAHMFHVFFLKEGVECKCAYVDKMKERYPYFSWETGVDSSCYVPLIEAYAKKHDIANDRYAVIGHWIEANNLPTQNSFWGVSYDDMG